jgi:Ca2+-binding RTX toxin-like protein
LSSIGIAYSAKRLIDQALFSLQPTIMSIPANSLLQQGLDRATVILEQFSNQNNFLDRLHIAFGNDFDTNVATGIASQFKSGDFSLLPEIQLLTEGELGTANGAYAGDLDQIFVSSDFLAQHPNDVNAVAELFLEEIGHKLDRLLNGKVDSPGDEGAIFRLLATGYPLSDEVLAGLKTQDDHATISVEGQAVAIETQFFSGTSGNDSFLGTDGDDDFFPGIGADFVDGKAGNDYLYIDSSVALPYFNQDTTVVYTTQTNGRITGGYSNGTTFRNIESMGLFTSFGNDNINLSFLPLSSQVGSGDGNDIVILGAGNDTISGGTGNDSLYGGAGNDKILGDDGNDSLYGGIGDDSLNGGLGNDVLDSAGGGLDTLEGSNGDDIYAIYNSADVIIEDVDYGTDTVWTAVNYTLSANVENMYLVGSVNGTGNTGDNTIVGYGIGDNVINGGGGNNTLIGGAGSDVLDSGGDGIDSLVGGTGDDTYGIYNSADVITENANEGIDTVWTAVNYALPTNVENLYLVGSINGYGNSGNNKISGYGVGDNVIDGGVGADTMSGGGGNDTYGVDNIGDVIVENANEGNDTVWTDVSYTLSANVENLYLVSSIDGTGNSSNNTIVGYGAGDNVIAGGGGNDTLYGGAGNDTFVFNSSSFLNLVITGVSSIGDFAANQDKIQLSKAAFTALSTASGRLSAYNSTSLTGDFVAVTNATEQTNALATAATIIYNSNTGALFYNADGNVAGFGNGGQFAVLNPGLNLNNTDFTAS